MTPDIFRIAKTINGPNETTHISVKELHALQDVRWGQLKAQEQTSLLRSAKFVLMLFEEFAARPAQPPPLPGTSLPPPIPGNAPPVPPAAASLPPMALETDEILRMFRHFVMTNATQWKMGAGDHHHPMWQLVAEEITKEDPTFGPDWAFVQAENRKPHQQLVLEYGEQQHLWSLDEGETDGKYSDFRSD